MQLPFYAARDQRVVDRRCREGDRPIRRRPLRWAALPPSKTLASTEQIRWAALTLQRVRYRAEGKLMTGSPAMGRVGDPGTDRRVLRVHGGGLGAGPAFLTLAGVPSIFRQRRQRRCTETMPDPPCPKCGNEVEFHPIVGVRLGVPRLQALQQAAVQWHCETCRTTSGWRAHTAACSNPPGWRFRRAARRRTVANRCRPRHRRSLRTANRRHRG